MAAAALTYALIRGGEHGWTDSLTLTAFAVAVVAPLAFVPWRRARAPHAGPGAAAPAHVRGLLGGALLYQAAAFSGLVYVSLWLQNVLGLSPIRGGLALMPMAGARLRRRGARRAATCTGSPRVPIGVRPDLHRRGLRLLVCCSTTPGPGGALSPGSR